MVALTNIKPIRIIIWDDDHLLRAGLRLLLENQPDFQVVADTGDLDQILKLVMTTNLDIILFEQCLEDNRELDFYSEINQAFSQFHMILIADSFDDPACLQAVKRGVMGIVTKSQPPEILVKAIRTVSNGRIWIDKSIIAKLVKDPFHRASGTDLELNGLEQLSQREREVIQWIGKGLPNKRIAEEMCIAVTTVRHYLTSIFSKLGVSDRLELLVFAHKNNLLNDPLAGCQGTLHRQAPSEKIEDFEIFSRVLPLNKVDR